MWFNGRGTADDRGLALVSVLVVVALLSIIAVSVTFSESVSYRLTQNDITRAKFDAATEAGIFRAILALLDPRIDRRWRVDGTLRDFEFAGAHLKVQIEDEQGKIDINAANGELLVNLFHSAGLDIHAASNMSDRVLDWREPGELRRLNGAKDPDYRGSGYSYGPRNGPFQTIDELKLVMGMTPNLFGRVEPAITIYSGRDSVNVQTAPREALLALPDMDADKVDALLELRAGNRDSGSAVPASAVADARGGRAFTIRAELATGETDFVREAVVRFTENAAQPYWILSWKMGRPLSTNRR